MKERQELWCHECHRYVQFDIDVALNGNHVITCPNCGHEHLRVVENGRVTEARWGSRNNYMQSNAGLTNHYATAVSSTTTSTYTMYMDTGSGTSSATGFLTYSAWMDMTTAS